MLVFGAFRRSKLPYDSYEAFREAQKAEALWHHDGRTATVTVLRHTTPYPGKQDEFERSLWINGKGASSRFGDLNTNILVGQLPLLLHPDPKRVLLVGLGVGVTAATCLKHASVEKVTLVEISESVVEANRFFTRDNDNVFDNPRFEPIKDDAKSFVRGQAQKAAYDVISSEPTNPWVAGVGGLFSEEYLRDLKSCLRPGGVLAQWFHLYNMNDETLMLVLRTIRSVFPYVDVFATQNHDILMICGDAPLELPDVGAMSARFDSDAIRGEFARIDMQYLSTLLSMQFLDSTQFNSLLERNPGPLNSDFFPRLETMAPHALYALATAHILAEEAARTKITNSLLQQYQRAHQLTDAERDEIRRFAKFKRTR